ncbi:MAG: type II toxin-antitoxin system RelE/ParE family toxin [Alphaproteobacteria bacterium]|nr:type II toxin-antitoxin system RelE/ParE family toxin [Alphaproteobacteria bacterium]
MGWKIDFTSDANRDLKRLDPQTRARILRFVADRLAQLDNPRDIGEALHGAELGKYWKYRVGDYRIIASIQDKLITIVVVSIGNRREVYRR